MSGPERSKLGDAAAADVANGMSVSEAAEKHGLTTGSVSNMCRIRGVKGQNVRGENRRQLMVEQVKQGKSMAEVSREFGVNISTVSRACSDAGLRVQRVWTE